MRVLVVEDDRALGEVVRRGLAEDGHAVDLVATFVDAAEAVFVEPYDLVVLDLGLPDGDGVDLCRSMRSAKLNSQRARSPRPKRPSAACSGFNPTRRWPASGSPRCSSPMANPRKPDGWSKAPVSPTRSSDLPGSKQGSTASVSVCRDVNPNKIRSSRR